MGQDHEFVELAERKPRRVLARSNFKNSLGAAVSLAFVF